MIIYSIVITALVMVAIVALAYEHVFRVKAEIRAMEAESDLLDARQTIVSYQIEKANRDGVEAGRATDVMYRKFLEQFDNHQQVKVIMSRDDAQYYEPKH